VTCLTWGTHALDLPSRQLLPFALGQAPPVQFQGDDLSESAAVSGDDGQEGAEDDGQEEDEEEDEEDEEE
jgi:hypothetical protein